VAGSPLLREQLADLIQEEKTVGFAKPIRFLKGINVHNSQDFRLNNQWCFHDGLGFQDFQGIQKALPKIQKEEGSAFAVLRWVRRLAGQVLWLS
jgi:hypothetical protein